MARRGGFASGLNPFGSGSLGGLGQYNLSQPGGSGSSAADVAANLAALQVYQTEIAWGNGQTSNAAYLAALQNAVGAEAPGTHQAYSAQNKLDDATYRIDRSNAESGGLDALIAFDNAALSRMSPDNLRYASVKGSLDSEMAQRRSRDYGKLIVDYNAGKTSTDTLLSWVNSTLGSLPADAPDFNSWSTVQTDLGERKVSEKDQTIYQDYQRGRIKAPEFLAYISGRRDTYDPSSPQYADWSRKVEDANAQVANAVQSTKDSTFFNRYQEGKVSDASYLLYLHTRVKGMAADDPQLGEWQHRLAQATFSLAEDKLRYDVQKGKAPVSRLTAFYTAYRQTLNPGSAEYRTISRNIDSLAGGAKVAGGGGGTGEPKASKAPGIAGAGVLGGPSLTDHGKAINPKYSLSNILGLFALNPAASKKDKAAAKAFLDLNQQTIGNAITKGDRVWLFHDPRTPGAVVSELDPQGNPTGRMVRGSAYLPVENAAMSNLLTVVAGNYMVSSEIALAKGDGGGSAYNLKRAGETYDQARTVDAHVRTQNWEGWYKATNVGIDRATMAGNYREAVQLSADLIGRLTAESSNPYLNDVARARLDELTTKLATGPLMPTFDLNGVVVDGAVNRAETLRTGQNTLTPGWHHVLKADAAGKPAWGPVYNADSAADPSPYSAWSLSHVTVNTTLGNNVVTGEVEKKLSSLSPMVVVRTATGYANVLAPAPASEISYPDENGRLVRAYSLDGNTWISPSFGQPAPTIEINADFVQSTDPKTGQVILKDATTGDVAFTQVGGGWKASTDYFTQNPGAIDWYGAAAWRAAKEKIKPVADVGFRPSLRTDAMRRSKDLIDSTAAERAAYLGTLDMGGNGQRMTLSGLSSSGQVNLVPSSWRPGSFGPEGTPDAIARPSLRTDATRRAIDLIGVRPAVAPSSGFSSYALPVDAPPRFEGLPGPIRSYSAAALTVANAPTFMPALSVPTMYEPKPSFTLPPLPALRSFGGAMTLPGAKSTLPPLNPVRPPSVVVGKPGLPALPPPPPPTVGPTATKRAGGVTIR